MARVKRARWTIPPHFYFQRQPSPPPPSSSEGSAPTPSVSDHGSSNSQEEAQEDEVQREEGEREDKKEREEEEEEEEEEEIEKEVEQEEQGGGSDANSVVVGVKRRFIQQNFKGKKSGDDGQKKLKKEGSKDDDGDDDDQMDKEPKKVEATEADDSSVNKVGHHEREMNDQVIPGKDKEEEERGERFAVKENDPTTFLKTVIRYRYEYLIYPFESQVAAEDFLKNWIKADFWTINRLENQMKKFRDRYLKPGSDADDDDHLDHEQQQKEEEEEEEIRGLVQEIWLAEDVGTIDDHNTTVRIFLDRLSNNVNNQITFLTRIIQYLPTTVTLPLNENDTPQIDDLINNWLKVEVPKSQLENAILGLRSKYIDIIIGSKKRENIADLGREDQEAIGKIEEIWVPVFGTHNTNTNDDDDDGMESSTEGGGKAYEKLYTGDVLNTHMEPSCFCIPLYFSVKFNNGL